jgi:hypothetical protein
MAKRKQTKARPRYERFVAVFDNHGDMQDHHAVDAFWDFMAHWKPTRKFHGGDAMDLRCLRRGASEEERADGVSLDITMGMDFVKRLDPEVWTIGNHDDRLWQAAGYDIDADGKTFDSAERKGDRHGMVQTLAHEYIQRIGDILPNTRLYPYHKRLGVHRVGHLKVLHGYNGGMYAARKACQVYGSCLMGHVHSIQHFSEPTIDGRMGRACGALCRLDMEYNRAQINTLNQSHGWAYGLLWADGSYTVWQAENKCGTWVYPSELRHLELTTL